MKKVLFFSLMVCVAVLGFAQESATYESTHYSVTSFVNADNAQANAEQLEAYMGVFNDYFHFDLSTLPSKLKVKIFENKARYDQYVQRLISETRDDFVYLHYSNLARSELVGYLDEAKKPTSAGTVHQAFVQFLRAFVANPPLWLREGFAVYFESTDYDAASKTAKVKENLAWLETFKSQVYGKTPDTAIGLDNLLKMGVDDAKTAIQTFYPQAWGLVHYLAQTDAKDQNRILWDAIYALKPTAPLDDNSKAVSKSFAWAGLPQIAQGMATYFQGKKTFPELVQSGIDAYNNGKTKDAEEIFTKANAANTANYVPYYYLGLINYDNGNYAKAEGFYKSALEKGATAALTNYALGVNAFADNRFDVAKTFLNTSKTLDAAYGDKVTDLLKRIDLESGGTTSSVTTPKTTTPATDATPKTTTPEATDKSTTPATDAKDKTSSAPADPNAKTAAIDPKASSTDTTPKIAPAADKAPVKATTTTPTTTTPASTDK